MTPDQIKEAAMREFVRTFFWALAAHEGATQEEIAAGKLEAHVDLKIGQAIGHMIPMFHAAIDAYEAAMDRHFDDAPRDGSIVLAKHFHFGWIEVRYADRGVWITRDGREITRVEHLEHFRPLPQPPEVKP